MGADIRTDTGAIMSTMLEGILYGFSLLMFCGTVWVLVFGRSMAKINKLMLSVAILLLLLSTTQIIFDIIRLEEGLVLQRDTFPGGPQAFFADVAQLTFMSRNSIFVIQTTLGDAVVIYRCYVVWQSVRIILIPCIMWCSVAATGIGSMYALSQGSAAVFAPFISRWIKSFYATSLSTNLLSTLLLAYRIWSIDRQTLSVRVTKSHLRPILSVVIDSGLLYSFTLVAALVCFTLESHGQNIILNMISPIISIAFFMVIIRVEISQNRNNTRFEDQSTLGGGNMGNHRRTSSNDSVYPMNGIKVHISKITETSNRSLDSWDAFKPKLASDVVHMREEYP
ncbi:hypothetical protein PILCRDRAFT_821390 [Piloderma croceum F 1598]|uniref:Uncharacterized protein n=1 Tax=Piloderma croceum (strain F 1598) TaxID=765440 RepID=A0A0C3FAJ1_PILCF|nr:hypothetical protein PILCRDRAFT_821390 [Piloderma croceum F 1598]